MELFLQDEQYASYIRQGINILDKRGFVRRDSYLEIIGDDRRVVKTFFVRKYWLSLYKKKQVQQIITDNSKYMVISNQDIDIIYDADVSTFSFIIKWEWKKQPFYDKYHCTTEHVKSKNFDLAMAKALLRGAKRLFKHQQNPLVN
tara:strand:- start:11083 stop:11517 length:435 start_codon:yes stop_codon:yes gene_type:complete